MSRYLHRPLLPCLHRLLAPGGLLLVHTFMDGAQNVGRRTPKLPRYLLQPGELSRLLAPELVTIVDSVILLADGRPTSCHLAQKPLAPTAPETAPLAGLAG